MEVTAQKNSNGLGLARAMDAKGKDNAPYLTLKKAEDPLQEIANIIGKTVKLDEPLVKILILAMVSAYTPIPVNVMVLAPQSEGKTYPIMEVAKIFPDGDRIEMANMTPKSLVREKGVLIDKNTGEPLQDQINALYDELNETNDKKAKNEINTQIQELLDKSIKLVNLEGKVLIFPEAPPMATLKELRPLLSRDAYEIDYKFVDKSGKHGKLVTQEARIRGFPVLIFATADNPKGEIWEQIKSRFLIVSPNMNNKKYREAILSFGNSEASTMTSGKISHWNEIESVKSYIIQIKRAIYTQYKNIYAQISNPNPKEVQVTWNPMGEAIAKAFPHEIGQNMRDIRDYLGIMRVSAVLSLFQRPYMELGGFGYWWITAKDLQIARELFANYHIFSRISKSAYKFLEDVLLSTMTKTPPTRLSVEGKEGYTKKDIEEIVEDYLKRALHWKTINERYMRELVDLGLVQVSKDRENNSRNLYTPITQKAWKTLESQLKEPKFDIDDLKTCLYGELESLERTEKTNDEQENKLNSNFRGIHNATIELSSTNNVLNSELEQIHKVFYTISNLSDKKNEVSESKNIENNSPNNQTSNLFQTIILKEGKIAENEKRIREIGENSLYDETQSKETSKLSLENDKLEIDLRVLKEIDSEYLNGRQFVDISRNLCNKSYVSEAKVKCVLNELMDNKILIQQKDGTCIFKGDSK